MTLLKYVIVIVYMVYLIRQLDGAANDDNDMMDDTDNATLQLTVTAFNLLQEAAFGTRTCVPNGNSTLYEGSLGHFKHLDSCCNRHFECPRIAAGESDDGATNKGLYPSYMCDCEEDLMRCLKKKVTNKDVEQVSEHEIKRIKNFGRVYFNEYGIYARCFRHTFQPVCNVWYLWMNSYRCHDYSFLHGYGKKTVHFLHMPIWGEIKKDEDHIDEAYPPYAPLAPGPKGQDVDNGADGADDEADEAADE